MPSRSTLLEVALETLKGSGPKPPKRFLCWLSCSLSAGPRRLLAGCPVNVGFCHALAMLRALAALEASTL